MVRGVSRRGKMKNGKGQLCNAKITHFSLSVDTTRLSCEFAITLTVQYLPVLRRGAHVRDSSSSLPPPPLTHLTDGHRPVLYSVQ
jgi:hypothetical protein